MKARVSGIFVLKSFVAAAIVATIPQVVQASDSQSKTVTTTSTSSASTKTAESVEIANLKRQLFLCHQRRHRKHKRVCAAPRPTAQVIETTKVMEKPVIVQTERVIEKEIFVDRPVAVEKQVIVETPVEMQKTILVEHSKHRRHLLHFGIPFLGSVTLF